MGVKETRGVTEPMAKRLQRLSNRQEEDCVSAFKSGNKLVAEQLLLCIPQPACITTTFEFSENHGMLASVSLVHLAAYWSWRNVVTALVSVYKCTVNCKDEKEHVPLHYASYNGHLELVKHFVVDLLCDPMDRNSDGETPLYCACQNNHLSIVKYFVVDLLCDPMDKNNDGETPLHCASQNGHLNITQYLIREACCNPSCVDSYGYTPLHNACSNGHLEISQYLIREEHCNPSCENNMGWTPLHSAVQNGHLIVAQYLIREKHCNPSCEDNNGCIPLHFACQNGHLNIAQYLIREEHSNLSCENSDGNTPLHLACLHNHVHIVQYLLSTGRINPLTENKYGHTALYYASRKYNIIKLFQPFEECRIAFPVHTFTKLILTGDSGAGKTTMTELIVRLASSTAVKCVTDAHRLTAGIVPHYIQSELGNFVVYDFAGQQEYYSSHAAMLEQVLRRSAAMFLCMVDLSESQEKICESIHYWLSFVDNACSTAKGTSHVMIVGSHADMVISSEEKIQKTSLLHKITVRRVKHQRYTGYLSMDCHNPDVNALSHLIATLTNSQKAIAASQPVISYYSHVVYAFLRTKLNVVGCTLYDLISAVSKENNSSLPNDQSVLTKILSTLSDRGLILFMHNHQSSWIVIKTEILLNKIIGTLFAPDHFKEYRDLASNTGIVPISNLLKVFPEYNSEMLVGFLTSLDFCRPVDPSVLQYSNLQTTLSHSTADLLFFPGLVQSERPDSLVQLEELEFGWCLRCMDPHDFLSSRFLHVLLLSIAYKFPLASKVASSSAVSGLQRICTVWRNGIFWRNLDNITTVIEILGNNKLVLMAMSCDDVSPVKQAELRSSLIALVHRLQQHYCPRLNVCEFLISPNLIKQYPLDNLPDTDLFDIHHVAQSLLLHKKVVPSYKDGRSYLTIKSFPFEPYHQLSSSSICQLLNPCMADQPITGPLLQEVRKLCRLSNIPQEIGELKEHLDLLSLFGDRNPLVSSV